MEYTHAATDQLDKVLARLKSTHPQLVSSLPELLTFGSAPFIFIVRDSSGHLQLQLSSYILSLNTHPGRRLSDRTIKSYVEVAISFESWLESQDIDISEARFIDIASYRNFLGQEKKLSDNSVNLHMAGVVRYVRWLVDDGQIVNAAPIHKWGVNNSRLAELRLRVTQPVVNVPTIGEFVELLRSISMPYRLMLIWYQMTGIRRSELPAINLQHIPESPSNNLYRIAIKRKGGYSQLVYVPLELMNATARYIAFNRQIVATRLGVDSNKDSPVFLNERGRRATGAAAYRALKKSAMKNNLEIKLHSLRHLYAVEVYGRLKELMKTNPDINPLKIVQKMLGHRSAETTALYLKSLPVPEEEISSALSSLFMDIEI